MARQIKCPLEIGGIYKWQVGMDDRGDYRVLGVDKQWISSPNSLYYFVRLEIIKEHEDTDLQISGWHSAIEANPLSNGNSVRVIRKDILSQKVKKGHWIRTA